MARLRRVDCSGPGITRRRRGRGFEYRDDAGRRVADEEVLERIRELAIPPAWDGVWVCPYPNGHLQATGIDAAGRKQYRYHDDWRARRDQEKFDAMLDFAATLPRMRRRGGGPELLAYREGRRWVDVRSEDINEYVKDATAEEHSAKDFRTWNGTMLAAVALSTDARNGSGRRGAGRPTKHAITEAVKVVAGFLGNTPAVARASYIDPRVFDRYLSGWTIAPALQEGKDAFGLERESTRKLIEKAVVDLIEEPRSAPRVEKLA